MFPSLLTHNAEAGPSRPRGPRNVERTYTGPEPSSLPAARDRTQAEKYFARVANENILPSRYTKAIGICGWLVGGFACVYMALYVDYGSHEHVFSPLRRQFRAFTQDLITLSPEERTVLGMDAPPRQPEPAATQSITESLRDPSKKRPS